MTVEIELMLENDPEARAEAERFLRDPSAAPRMKSFLSLALARSATLEQRRQLLASLQSSPPDVTLPAFNGCSFRRSDPNETLDQRKEIWLGLLLKVELRELLSPRFIDVYLRERFDISVDEAMASPMKFRLNFPEYVAHREAIKDPELIGEARRLILGSSSEDARCQVFNLVSENAPEILSLALDVYKNCHESALLRRTAANLIASSNSESRLDIMLSLFHGETDDDARAHLLSLFHAYWPKQFEDVVSRRAEAVQLGSKEHHVCLGVLGEINDLKSLSVLARHYDAAPDEATRGVILAALNGPTKDEGCLGVKRSLVAKGLDDASPSLRMQAMSLALALDSERFRPKLQAMSQDDPDLMVRALAKKLCSGK